MLLRRLTAVILALMLLVQLTACKQNSPSDTGSNISVSNEEIYSDNTTNDNQDTNGVSSDYNSENNSDLSSDNVCQNNNSKPQPDSTVSNNQSPDNSQPDNDNDNENNNNDDSDSTTPVVPVVRCEHGDEDPYKNVNKSEFYASYSPSCCNLDASYRSKHYLLSGSLEVPGQYAQEASNRPKSGNKFVRNTATMYLDNGNTYVVMDATGREVMRIHKSGGYITLEEVAAYMYAFGGSGSIPANYSTKKSTKPSSSPWGEYLRVNHSYFKGDTDRYPYEPELPDISGCGGSLSYYEMDIGTTGTTTPGYAPKPYIQGSKITRGAARLVYARQDLNRNGVFETNEVYVFYTHNHYNDFREYLNYYGGWGEMFGNVTGGGEYSSDYNANPTPYVPTAYADFTK